MMVQPATEQIAAAITVLQNQAKEVRGLLASGYFVGRKDLATAREQVTCLEVVAAWLQDEYIIPQDEPVQDDAGSTVVSSTWDSTTDEDDED